MVCDGRDEGLHGAREEFGESKRFGGIAAERIRGLGGVEVGENGLVEAEVGPARQEAEYGEEEGGEGEQGCESEEEDDTQVEQGETWNTEGENAAE